MQRREFITLLGGGAAAWPLAVRAQQPERMRRIGVLMNVVADNPQGQAGVATFEQALQQLGWSAGRNRQIDTRWGAKEVDRRRYAAELVALGPEVILASGSPSVMALRPATRTVPIVFVRVVDPVGAGFVDSLSRPGGNVTGFMLFEYSLCAKWLERLKQIVPNLTRAAVIRDPDNVSSIGQVSAIQGAARLLGVDISLISTRNPGEIERAITAFARAANGGLIVTGTASESPYGNLIVALAAEHKLPAIYGFRADRLAGRSAPSAGGLRS